MIQMNQSKGLVRMSIVACCIALLIMYPGSCMTVYGGKIAPTVVPGQTYTFPMAVSLSPTDAAADYAIGVYGFGQYSTGVYRPLDPSADTSPYSARGYTTVDQPKIHLDPGDRKAFNVTIRVPQNPGDGGRYALILVRPAPQAGEGASVTVAFQDPVMLTISGSKLTKTGTISEVKADEVTTGTPLTISTTLLNTGNYHYYNSFVNVTITDASGNMVATASTRPTDSALIPGCTMTFTTPITATLPEGTYTVKSDAKLADGMVLLDSKTTTFTIQAPYVPPTPTPKTSIAGATQPPAGSTPAPAGTKAPNKIPFLPIYTPFPDALATVGVVSAALFLWSARRRR